MYKTHHYSAECVIRIHSCKCRNVSYILPEAETSISTLSYLAQPRKLPTSGGRTPEMHHEENEITIRAPIALGDEKRLPNA